MDLTDMINVTITSVLLLQIGETISSLPHGIYHVSGGDVIIGHLPSGNLTRITGIVPVGEAPPTWVSGSQPYNKNLGCILFELKQTGIRYLSNSMVGSDVMDYIKSYRVSQGTPLLPSSEIPLSFKLINGISK